MSDSNNATKNLEIVKIMLENGHARRWDVVRPYVHDSLVMRVPASLPFGGDYHGWQGYTDILKAIVSFFSEIKGRAEGIRNCRRKGHRHGYVDLPGRKQR